MSGPNEVSFNKKESNPVTATELLVQAKSNSLNRLETIVVQGGKNYVQPAKSAFSSRATPTPLGGCRGIGFMMPKLERCSSGW